MLQRTAGPAGVKAIGRTLHNGSAEIPMVVWPDGTSILQPPASNFKWEAGGLFHARGWKVQLARAQPTSTSSTGRRGVGPAFPPYPRRKTSCGYPMKPVSICTSNRRSGTSTG